MHYVLAFLVGLAVVVPVSVVVILVSYWIGKKILTRFMPSVDDKFSRFMTGLVTLFCVGVLGVMIFAAGSSVLENF